MNIIHVPFCIFLFTVFVQLFVTGRYVVGLLSLWLLKWRSTTAPLHLWEKVKKQPAAAAAAAAVAQLSEMKEGGMERQVQWVGVQPRGATPCLLTHVT
jgi:hypothetical protein